MKIVNDVKEISEAYRLFCYSAFLKPMLTNDSG